MLSNLGVRQKLSVLLLLPMITVVLAIIPLTVDRLDSSRAARLTASLARDAQQVGPLIGDLQQERLLSLGYLVLPAERRAALIVQQQQSRNDAAVVPESTAPLAAEVKDLALLDGFRARVLAHEVGAFEIFSEYQTVIRGLMDALRLTNEPAVDAPGQRQLNVLDALLRDNEAESQISAATLVAAASPGDTAIVTSLLTVALTLSSELRARFGELADAEQNRAVSVVYLGSTGPRITALATQLSVPHAAPVPLTDVLSTGESAAQLLALVEERTATNIADAADLRASASGEAALAVGVVTLVLLIVVISLSVRISRSIATPLRRLTHAAAVVADLAGSELVRVSDTDEAQPAAGSVRLAAVNVGSTDEIGELAAAFNRVQATAAMLVERQVTTRRNVAVMFANIARRTQSLVGRQLSLIDDMEATELDDRVLDKLYRLDHLTTRLRRSADSLLVVAGVQDESYAPPSPLIDVIRSGMAEIEGFDAVRLGDVPGVLVNADLTPDLRLIMAELLENAAAFSPPGSPVEVAAAVGGDRCQITIVDHGIGMPPARMDEENRRLFERQRLDVAPTRVLGLFVVGRLARRHGLAVTLAPTPEQGVTATVSIPLSQLVDGPALTAPRPVNAAAAQPAIGPGAARTVDATWHEVTMAEPAARSAVIEPLPAARSGPAFAMPAVDEIAASVAGPFDWFVDATAGHGSASTPVGRAAVPVPDPRPWRDPHAEQASLADFVQGTQRAQQDTGSATPPPPVAFPVASGRAAPPGTAYLDPTVHRPAPRPADAPARPVAAPEMRAGLVRRVPGANLGEAARVSAPPAGMSVRVPIESPAPPRDPEAERSAIESFMHGFARATEPTPPPDPRNAER